MDTTPIYNELQQKLIDPEEDNWGPSAPPEFASSLAQQSEPAKQAESDEPEASSSQHSSSQHSSSQHSSSQHSHSPLQQASPQSSRSGSSARSGGRRHRAEE